MPMTVEAMLEAFAALGIVPNIGFLYKDILWVAREDGSDTIVAILFEDASWFVETLSPDLYTHRAVTTFHDTLGEALAEAIEYGFTKPFVRDWL